MDDDRYWTITWDSVEHTYQEFLVCSEELALESYANHLLREPGLVAIKLEETNFYGEPFWTTECHTIT